MEIIDKEFINMLRSPVSEHKLTQIDNTLVSDVNGDIFNINDSGIPLFAESFCTDDAKRQQQHYDKVAEQYLKNLTYPHTQEYMSYLDDAFLSITGSTSLGNVAEICCGGSEAFPLLGNRAEKGVGVDISESMLQSARKKLPEDKYLFIQGDATNLPLNDEIFDNVFILGGIHHVNEREKLFSEIYRILKPCGKFYFMEPVSDFALWRAIRAVIYSTSSALDSETERPLLYNETVPPLQKAGFTLDAWNTHGFLGYCLLMNSDILVFNRLFQYVPYIRKITHFMTKLDDITTKAPGMKKSGLIVAGSASKPC